MAGLRLIGFGGTQARRWPLAAALAAMLAVPAAAPAQAESLSGLYLAGRHAEALPDYAAAGRFYRRALLRAPGSVELLAPALHYTILSGATSRAPAIARQLVQHDPGDRIALLTLIADDIRKQNFDAALERLDGAPAGALTDFMATLLDAWITEGAGDKAAVDAVLAAAERDDRLAVYAFYNSGLIAMTRGDFDAAIAGFEKTLEAGGRLSVSLAVPYGAALERAGRAEEAEKIYRQVLVEDPREPVIVEALARMERDDPAPLPIENAVEGAAEAFFALGGALSQESGGGRRFALIYAQLALYLRPDYSAALLLAGRNLDDLDQHAPAAEIFDRVAAETPVYVDAQLGRARALAAVDRKDEARAALRELAAQPMAPAEVYFTLAEMQSSDELFEECAASYDVGIDRLGPITERHWAVFFSRGICRERTGAWESAERDFEKALSLRPNQPDVLNYLGYSLVEQGKRLAEARDMIERAVAARPESGYIVDSLGWVLYRLGDYDRAVTELERAVELTPVEPVINDHFGDALWRVGRRMEARFQWRRALSFDPEDKDRERIERKLELGLDTVLEQEAAAQDQGGALPGDGPKNADAAPASPSQGG